MSKGLGQDLNRNHMEYKPIYHLAVNTNISYVHIYQGNDPNYKQAIPMLSYLYI